MRSKTPRASTLDTLTRATSPSELSLIAQTGDILLCGLPRDTKVGWGRLLIAFGGSAIQERRLPIVHAAVIIRNPPEGVRAAYDLPQDDTQVFVLQASLKHSDGCRLTTIDEWSDAMVNGGMQYRIFYRGIAAGTADRQMQKELWDWLLMARKIPYFSLLTKDGTWLTYNACFIPGTYTSTVSVATELTAEMIKDILSGTGPIGYLVTGIVGALANIAWALVFASLFLLTFIFSFPQLLVKKRIERVHVGSDEKIKGLTCSATVAKTLMRAGLLQTTADATWYHPRDFLPQGVCAHTNMLDVNVVPGVRYSDKLNEILLQGKAPRKRDSLRYSFLSTLDAELMKFDE